MRPAKSLGAGVDTFEQQNELIGQRFGVARPSLARQLPEPAP
jgi:hypothetical protein